MRIQLLGLLLLASFHSGYLLAQPIDLLQQLYGRPSVAIAKPSAVKKSAGEGLEPKAKPTITLSLRPSIAIARERIYLSDLVSCRGQKQSCDELQAIDYGEAPKATRQDRLARAPIEAVIHKEFGGDGIEVLWEGADLCLVTALSSPIDEEAVVRVLDHEFQSAPPGMRVIIQSLRVPMTQVLRHNNYAYKIPNFTDQISRVYNNPRSRFAQIKVVAVDQDPSSRANIEFIAQVNLRVEIQALVMTQTRERGERLTPEWVELQWIPYQDQLVNDDKLVLGKLLRVRVMAKQAVRTWDLTREPEVLRGDRIEAVISSGGIKMNSVAQALEPGFIGQKIRIRLEATKKNVLGLVIARSQVEVPSL